MSPLERFAPDTVLAIAVAAWFLATGVAKVAARPATGRRAVAAEPGWQVVLRRIRGVLEILGGLAVAAGGVIGLLGMRVPFPGLALGFTLSTLAAWTVLDHARMPIRPVRLGVAVLGFALAVFFAGFRD